MGEGGDEAQRQAAAQDERTFTSAIPSSATGRSTPTPIQRTAMMDGPTSPAKSDKTVKNPRDLDDIYSIVEKAPSPLTAENLLLGGNNNRDVDALRNSQSNTVSHDASHDTPHVPDRTPRPDDSNSKLAPVDTSGSDESAKTVRKHSADESSTGLRSPMASDRVFPIRSVVSVDPNPTPSIRSDGGRSEGNFLSNESVGSAGRNDYFTPQTPYSPNVSSPQPRRTDPFFAGGTATRGQAQAQSQQQQNQNRITSGNARPSYRLRTSSTINDVNQFQIPTEDARSERTGSTKSIPRRNPQGARSVNSEQDVEGIITARFKHVVTENGHAIITGRDGDVLQRCEDEPIHIPGAIQSFGALVALQEEDDGRLTVRVASENCLRLIGYSPSELFQIESFNDILSDEQSDNLLDHIDFIKDDDADPANNGPEVFMLAIRSPQTRKLVRFWTAIHMSKTSNGLIICEFELEDDIENPLQHDANDEPDIPEDTLNSNPTAEELADSTIGTNKPLRMIRNARRSRRGGEAAAMEVFNVMSQVTEQLAAAPNIDAFLKVLVGVVKELTGFHRVMVYQFDQQWNGRVVTELVDPRATKDLYKGLNFPASDIPKQARDLYKVNKVRLLYDRDQITARLVCRTIDDLETPLDLTHAYLRAMSPIHIKYLANMAVRASMSISINAFDELWGLISCHAYGAKGTRVQFPVRKMCRLVGESASRNIERLSYASRLQARKLINTIPTEKNPSGYIIASSDDLLKLFDADSGLLSIRDETKVLGSFPTSTQEALVILEYLRMRHLGSVASCQDIAYDFPDLKYEPGFSDIAGFLFVPLSSTGTDFIVFFRKGQLREVKWAGDPYSKFVREGTEGYLEPRKSFKTWTEKVYGKCREWSEEQIETAAVLCLVYGKFIEVWRQKEAALQSSQLTKLLLANSAHEVRTPLNAIINYLEIALEGAIDQDTRDNLTKSHSASKSLIYVINDLLDLTKTEEGKDLLVKDVAFDLHAMITDATEIFRNDTERKNLEYIVTRHDGLPLTVVGDQRRVRQAITNLIANAVQHTSSGSIKVDAWLSATTETGVEIDVAVEDTGAGMSTKQVDNLFRQLEEVDLEEDILAKDADPHCKAIADSNTADSDEGSPKEKAPTLGIGLAVVSRIVRNMNGQLRVKSEEGRGSRFVICLPFSVPDSEAALGFVEGSSAVTKVPSLKTQPSDGSGAPATPPITEGEKTLINKPPKTPKLEVSRRNSSDTIGSTASANSLGSMRSGQSGKSDVDRLIDAIQEPLGSTRLSSESQRKKSVDVKTRAISSSGGVSGQGNVELERRVADQIKAYEADQSKPGQVSVKDSRTPVRSIRIPEGAEDGIDLSSMTSPPTHSEHAHPETTPRKGGTSTRPPGVHRTHTSVTFEIPNQPLRSQSVSETPPSPDGLHILVAEDDPVNSRIITKRLQKLGHKVHLTANGEQCASAHGDTAHNGVFDAILMDIQMPIVDGLTSTKMIRSYEKAHPNMTLSQRAESHGRIPIIAVSASLQERLREEYIALGFDAWILKPIDFSRLSTLLEGITSEKMRSECLYREGKGMWEKGGWFVKSLKGIYDAETAPEGGNGKRPSDNEQAKGPGGLAEGMQTKDEKAGKQGQDAIDREQDRLGTLTAGSAIQDESVPSSEKAPQLA